MKKIILILLLGTMALPPLLPAQFGPVPGVRSGPNIKNTNQLTQFDLDFAGGTPAELAKAIETARHKAVNLIIPEDAAQFRIPAFKLKGVSLPELFEAMTSLGRISPAYAFTTRDQPPQEDSIWVFAHDNPATHQVICRYYQLAPFLDPYKVEDITTAIETGWKMLGDVPFPKLSFHKDTKLLIAVGEPAKLALIDSVLQQLIVEKRIDSQTGLPPRRPSGK